MNELTEKGEYDIAEAFNNAFKPLVDMLLKFELTELDLTIVEKPWHVSDDDDSAEEK